MWARIQGSGAEICAAYWYSHSRGGAEGSTNSSVLGEHAEQVTGNVTEHTPRGHLLGRSTQQLLFQWEHSSPANLTHSLQLDLGLLLQQLGTRPCPNGAGTTTEQRGGPAQHPGQAAATTSSDTPPSRADGPAQRGKTRQASIQKQPSHQKHSTQTGYAGMVPFKNSCS